MRRSFPFAVRKLSCHSQSSWKSDVILVILLLALPLFAISYGCQGRKVAFYHNDYHSIQPGKTTLKEVISILGPYLEVQETPDGHNYRFQKVVVNFSGLDRTVVNTIGIDRDPDYVSSRGIRLGDPVGSLCRLLGDGKDLPTTVCGPGGIDYWNDGDVVTEIVLFSDEHHGVQPKETTDYHGIQPGKTTLKEVISILGPYLEVQETPNGHNYRFQKVVVNFSGSNRSVVNTLTIDRDRGYTSPRGIRLGDPVSCLDQFRHNGRYVPTAVFDATHGVFYWNDGEVVTLIALVYRVLR